MSASVLEQRVRASPFPVAAKARCWNSAAWPTRGLRVYAFFQRSGLRQSALRLLCRLLTSVLRSDRLTASPVSFPRQQRRSPEVRPTAFTARPPDLPPRPLMAVDFAIIGSLVRSGRPHIRFLSIGPRLCSTLPSDPTLRRRPCASLILRHHQAGWRTSTSKLSIMLGTPKRPRTSGASSIQGHWGRPPGRGSAALQPRQWAVAPYREAANRPVLRSSARGNGTWPEPIRPGTQFGPL